VVWPCGTHFWPYSTHFWPSGTTFLTLRYMRRDVILRTFSLASFSSSPFPPPSFMLQVKMNSHNTTEATVGIFFDTPPALFFPLWFFRTTVCTKNLSNPWNHITSIIITPPLDIMRLPPSIVLLRRQPTKSSDSFKLRYYCSTKWKYIISWFVHFSWWSFWKIEWFFLFEDNSTTRIIWRDWSSFWYANLKANNTPHTPELCHSEKQ
jgi:hypothetical protein